MNSENIQLEVQVQRQEKLKYLKVSDLVNLNFQSLHLSDKIFIRDLCHPRPDIIPAGLKDKIIKSSKVYKDFPWVCGCVDQNLYFCFPCLLFNKIADKHSDSIHKMFARVGLNNPHRFGPNHSKTQEHMKNSVQLAMLGKVSVVLSVVVNNRYYSWLLSYKKCLLKVFKSKLHPKIKLKYPTV